MGAILGASTRDIEMYQKVLKEVSKKSIEIEINRIEKPEAQRIYIEASERNAVVDSLNRGGGRLRLLEAEPSLEEAILAAKRLGIKLAEI